MKMKEYVMLQDEYLDDALMIGTQEELSLSIKAVIKMLYEDAYIEQIRLDDHICRICDILDMPVPVGMPRVRRVSND